MQALSHRDDSAEDSLPRPQPSPTPVTRSSDTPSAIRALVRLVQCQQCSKPFTVPVTLPCGHSVCRACLPLSHRRLDITYPRSDERDLGITCPIPYCGTSHPVGECRNDVVLGKILQSIQEVANDPDIVQVSEHAVINIAARPRQSSTVSNLDLDPPAFRSVPGGKILGTFNLAQSGALAYDAECDYIVPVDSTEHYDRLDEAVLAQVKEEVHKEVDCQICFAMLLDPITTPCGHTFCRKCLARVLDHTILCPACRKHLPLAPSLINHPPNYRLVSLLLNFWPDQVAARMESSAAEDEGTGEFNTPLFISNLAFIGQPCYLHIFEPRYRLMIRRAWNSNKKFGMLAYNNLGLLQGELGAINFLRYGTMLQIDNVRLLPDGRSLIETRGLYTFKVNNYSNLDGYMVGNVERVDDLTMTEEEEQEQLEIRHHAARMAAEQAAQPSSPIEGGTPSSPITEPDLAQSLDGKSTEELYQACRACIERGQAASAPWLNYRIIQAYGNVPEDYRMFAYWIACVLPIADEEKYQLLYTRSVRERLKITNSLLRRIEARRWYVRFLHPT